MGKYVDTKSFEILLIAYAFDNEEVKIIDLTKEKILPQEFMEALQDNTVLKSAYNAIFEITCLNKFFHLDLDINQWICTMVWGAMAGLPFGLEPTLQVLQLPEKKDLAGKRLIKFFSTPPKNSPEEHKEKWEEFIQYCKQDVEAERSLKAYLHQYKILPFEWELWRIDTIMAMKGVRIDIKLINNILSVIQEDKKNSLNKLESLTKLSNPNSTPQLKQWLEKELGQKIKGLTKEDTKDLIKKCKDTNNKVVEVLTLKQDLSKTSLKKYDAMESSHCSDGTIKGLLQFYGGNRTGRWAGRNVQIQNLPQNHINNIKVVRDDFKNFDYKALKLIYDKESLQELMSQLIRTAIIPEGDKFIVSDFAAIEARILSYLANEKWRLDVFADHGKIYEASASQMFGVDINKITKDSYLRQKGKIAELALGYGGSVGALKSMGALKMGLDENELPNLVKAWRLSNPNITKFWKDCEKACIKAIKHGEVTFINNQRKLDNSGGKDLSFYVMNNNLCIKLPSGRIMYYKEPKLTINQYGMESITYMGVNQTSKKWTAIETFGGKLVENIVQGVARDCLAVTIKRLHGQGYNVVFHVHDEVVVEGGTLKDICQIMSQEILWAKGLPLKGEAYECEFYRK